MRGRRMLFKSVLATGLVLLMLVQLMAPIASQTMTSTPVLADESVIETHFQPILSTVMTSQVKPSTLKE